MKAPSLKSPGVQVPWYRLPLTWFATVTVIFLVGGLSQVGVLAGLELKIRDWNMTTRGTQTPKARIVIIEIDRASVSDPKMQRPLMFWGPYHARVLQILNGAGAKAVGMDFIQPLKLGEYAQPDPDQPLAQEIALSSNLVLSYTRNQMPDGTIHETVPNELLATALALGGGQQGLVNTVPDFDGTVRRFASTDSDGSSTFALSLASAATGQKPQIAGRVLRMGERQLALDGAGDGIIDFIGPEGTFPRINYRDLLAQPQEYRSLLKDSVCLIGITVYELQDFHYVPFSQLSTGKRSGLMAGVEVQANILHTLLAGNAIRQVSPPILWLSLALAALLAVPLAWKSRIRWLIPVAVVVLTSWFAVSWLAFAKGDWQLPVVAVAMAFATNYLLLTIVRFAQESQRKRWVEGAMGRVVSPQVLEYLSRDPSALELGGHRQEITILFSDVRGFTTLSEELEPEKVTLFLNSYFEKMVEIVFQYGGTVDKFMGDGIMVIYNWPVAQNDHANRALQTALQMQRAVSASAEEWRQMGMPPIEIGIGIHTGPAILGNIGSKRRMNPTAIGDTVNVSSRVEGLCKTLGKSLECGILLSETSYKAAQRELLVKKDTFEVVPAGETVVRGRREALQLFGVKLIDRE